MGRNITMKFKVGDIVQYRYGSIHCYGKVLELIPSIKNGHPHIVIQLIADDEFTMYNDGIIIECNESAVNPLKEALQLRLKQFQRQKDALLAFWNEYGDKQTGLLDEV